MSDETKPNGGPAFPMHPSQYSGMTSPARWPFPTQPLPTPPNNKPPRFNPDNYEDAPL